MNAMHSERFDEFYRSHHADAVRWAIALTGSRDAAEDVAHDALLAVAAKLDQIDNPAGYLRRTVVNRAISVQRSRGRERRRARQAAAGQPSSYTAPTTETLDALATLPFKLRAAVTLRYWADWTDEQIAEALGCAPATVRVRIHRGVAALRKEFER